jgi:hypothetical protein
MLNWTDEQLEAVGLDPKKVESIVRRLRKISEEMRALDLNIYGASGSGHLMHASRPSHTGPGQRPDQDAPIASVGLGFDGGDW